MKRKEQRFWVAKNNVELKINMIQKFQNLKFLDFQKLRSGSEILPFLSGG